MSRIRKPAPVRTPSREGTSSPARVAYKAKRAEARQEARRKTALAMGKVAGASKADPS